MQTKAFSEDEQILRLKTKYMGLVTSPVYKLLFVLKWVTFVAKGFCWIKCTQIKTLTYVDGVLPVFQCLCHNEDVDICPVLSVLAVLQWWNEDTALYQSNKLSVHFMGSFHIRTQCKLWSTVLCHIGTAFVDTTGTKPLSSLYQEWHIMASREQQ